MNKPIVLLSSLLLALALIGGCSESPPAPAATPPASSAASTSAPQTERTAASATSDWPMWGRTLDRNMIAPEASGLPTSWHPGTVNLETQTVDLTNARHIRWVAKLGSQSYGNPTVSAGRVYLGTNNAFERDPKFKGDRSNVLCLDEKTGEMIWMLSVPKLGAGKVSDWEFLGICSSPAVDDKRVYVVTNRCEVIALDVQGLANGNDGPFTDEAAYYGGAGSPIEPSANSADILWVYDMREELGVFPHNITSNSVLIHGDRLLVATSNGVDWSHTNIPNPRAPALIMLDKNTGELLGEESSGISQRMLHCNWSSPTAGVFDGQTQYIFGAGDGHTYGFDPEPVKDADGFSVFKELWRVDCNPPEYWKKDGKPIKYTRFGGPSEVIGTPVAYEGRIYVTIGQDPEHGAGVGALTCINPTVNGKAPESVIHWQFKGIGRSMSTPSIADGLVYIADYAGKVYCLDAGSGELYWEHDTQSHIWGSTLLADGKVYLGNEQGVVFVFAEGREKKLLEQIDMGAPVYGTPIVANNVLYIMSMNQLYAIEAKVP